MTYLDFLAVLEAVIVPVVAVSVHVQHPNKPRSSVRDAQISVIEELCVVVRDAVIVCVYSQVNRFCLDFLKDLVQIHNVLCG